MQLSIRHSTKYTFEGEGAYGLQELRLTPKSRPSQNVLNWQTEVEGGKIELQFEDQHANTVLLVSFDGSSASLQITCSGEVVTNDIAGILGRHGGFAPLWYFRRNTKRTAPGPLIRKLVREVREDESDPIARLHRLSSRIRSLVSYETGTTTVHTTAEEALDQAKGVCQDHAQIFVSASRLLGLSSRYVSGYLMMDDRVDQDATHAWAETHVEGIGWVAFDVSNGISPDERYVRVATGLDYSEAAPVSGMRWGNQNKERLAVSLQVAQ
ncbi:MAG: transglutaminase family protein [Pseudomonadota bacterium]